MPLRGPSLFVNGWMSVEEVSQMSRKYYHKVEAKSHYDLGLKLGARFAKPIYCAVRDVKRNYDIHTRWYKKIFKRELERVGKAFPHVVQELVGYAKGADVELDEMWWTAIGDDIDNVYCNHCTTVVTNNGLLIGHNEDWSAECADELYIVKKSVPGLTILELYYAGGLGGNAISINSKGFVHAVNSLPQSPNGEGLPRDLIARWLSETGHPEADHQKMESLSRMSGYAHNIASPHRKIYSIESCAGNTHIRKRRSPFCHTNHFLRKIKGCPTCEDVTNSKQRRERAKELAKARMKVTEMKELLSDTVGRGNSAIFNENTIGRVVVDLESRKAHIWLLRDERSGWVTYDIRFLR